MHGILKNILRMHYNPFNCKDCLILFIFCIVEYQAYFLKTYYTHVQDREEESIKVLTDIVKFVVTFYCFKMQASFFLWPKKSLKEFLHVFAGDPKTRWGREIFSFFHPLHFLFRNPPFILNPGLK